MSFAFLAPHQVEQPRGEGASLRSAIHWLLEDAGARFVPRSGWHVARDFGSAEAEFDACQRRVGLVDMSCLGKIELQGSERELESLALERSGAIPRLGVAVRASGGDWWCPITTNRLLVITPAESTARCLAELEEVAGTVLVTELTTSLGSQALIGPLARETLARLTALDLRPAEFEIGALAPGSVARTPGVILRFAEAGFLHLFGAAYSAYLWTATHDAAESLDGQAVGWRALDETPAGKAMATHA